MMGTKARAFAAFPPVSLEDLVAPGHLYRHLERSLDLGFVRDPVRDAYVGQGRPSIDPVVFFKLQPVLFFAGCARSGSSSASWQSASACAGIWGTTCTSRFQITPA